MFQRMEIEKSQRNSQAISPKPAAQFVSDGTFKFGQYKGKKYEDVPFFDADNYARFLSGTAYQREGKPMRPDVMDFVNWVYRKNQHGC